MKNTEQKEFNGYYGYADIKTKEEQILVTNATLEIYSLIDDAEYILDEVLASDFITTADGLRDNPGRLSNFLEQYPTTCAKLRAVHDFLYKACTIFDFMNEISTKRTDFFINKYNSLLSFAGFYGETDSRVKA